MALAYNVPGVVLPEQDFSQYTLPPPVVGAALVTPTVKGPAFLPTYVSSYADFENKFGASFKSGSDYYEYLGSITAREYFASGGQNLLVVSIKSGSYAPATSSAVQQGATGSACFTLETLGDGAVMNSFSAEVTGSNGALLLGSADNLRWEIANVKTGSGTFSLLIRQGNDTHKQKRILEQYDNLSLDPSSPDYIAARIGDTDHQPDVNAGMVIESGSFDNVSRYVRVKEVLAKTPDALDTNSAFKVAYYGSLPLAGSGSFGGASDGAVHHPMKFNEAISTTNAQGFTPTTDAYDTALSLLANPNGYLFDYLLIPGITAQTHPAIAAKALATVEERGDSLLVLDLIGYGYTATDVIAQAAGFDSNMGASYWPWVQLQSLAVGKKVWVPASTVMAGVFAYNDYVGQKWNAPAGENRGKLTRVKRAEKAFNNTQLGQLLDGNVNPLQTFMDSGVMVWGQQTLQKRLSANDRVGVRRLVLAAKLHVKQKARTFVFEQNTTQNRFKFLAAVTPYFEDVRQKQGLYAFSVEMNDETNTPEVIDRGQMVGRIKLQPTRTAEVIIVGFEVHASGAVL